MGYGIKLIVEGDYACFTRPEMKVERVSYDVITPSACRGILDSIYWKPAITWVIDKIYVYNPINFINIRRNEVKNKVLLSAIKSMMKNENKPVFINADTDRTQRCSQILKDVRYGIEAHFELTNKASVVDTKEKHYNMAIRRMKKGQCFKQPILGCREFYAKCEFVEELAPSTLEGEIDLGYMLYSIGFITDYNDECSPIFYRPHMIDGIIDIMKYTEEVAR